jgi:hypothetical protein
LRLEVAHATRLSEEGLPDALLIIERILGGGACWQGKKQEHDPDATRHFQFPPALKFAARLRL